MEESQVGVDYHWSQDIDDMPNNYRQYKKQKTSYRPKPYGTLVKKIPRAIQTRGTPQGYYEIPVRHLFRLYGNSSSGVWNTNQTTNAAIGVIGYGGFAYYSQYDAAYINLGNGGISASVIQTIPDTSATTALFDLCKISDIEVEFWVSNPAREMSTTAGTFGAIEVYVVQDTNDAIPPNNLQGVLDRTKVLRVVPDGRKYKMSFKPYITMDASSNDGAASTSTIALASPSTYFRTDRPSVSHFGFKGWVVTPSDGTATSYSLNMLVTQKRRLKMNQ